MLDVFFALALLRASKAQTYTIPIVPVCDSTSNEYLEISSLACSACDDDSDGTGRNANKVPDTSALDRYGNALSCRCADGYISVAETCSSGALRAGTCRGFTCTSCLSDGESAYSDHSACVRCGNSTSGVSDTLEDCSCPVDTSDFTELLLETDAGGAPLSSKECTACTNGTRIFLAAGSAAGVSYAADPYMCQSCPDPQMSFDSAGACSCSDAYTQAGVAEIGPLGCVEADRASAVAGWNTAAAYQVSYSYVRTTPLGLATGSASVSSLTLQHYFLAAAAGCYEYSGPGPGGSGKGVGDGGDAEACQTLANLCVLQMYDESSKACSLFETVTSNRGTTTYDTTNWAATLPWLYYDTATDARAITGVGMTVTFSTTLRFRLARYSVDGQWLGLEDLGTQPYFCGMPSPDTGSGGGTSRSTKYLEFGTGASTSFTCDLSTLVEQEPALFDMYLVDTSTDTLYPVAVLVTNFPGQVNENAASVDEADDRFTRRFFFFDTVSGISDSSAAVSTSTRFSSSSSYPSSATSTSASAVSLVPEVIRYAKSMRLSVVAQSSAENVIYAPTLEITYEEVKPSSWAQYGELQTPSITWEVEYTMNVSAFWTTCRAFFAVGLVLCSMAALWRFRNLYVRNSRTDVPPPLPQQLPSIDWELLMQCLVLAGHTFVLVFFPFTFALSAYWFIFFKLQDTVYLLLPSERPEYGTDNYYPLKVMIHMLFIFQLLRVVQLTVTQSRVDIFFVDWERPASAPAAKAPSAGSSGASVWRQIFVANEWNELQTARRTDVRFTLMWLAFLLLGLNLEYLATPQPNIADTSSGELNPVLQFANATFWWLLLGLGQWFWRWAVAERYLGEPPEQRFVDLATMAKVSTLALDERYHGFYLHCRSPYPRADVTMAEMVAQLGKEEAGLSTDRGLEGCPAGLQCFELFTTATWRRKYDRLYAAVLQQQQASRWWSNSHSWHLGANTGPPGTASAPNLANGRLGIAQQWRSAGGYGWGGHFAGADPAAEARLNLSLKPLLCCWSSAPAPPPSEAMVAAARDLTSFVQGFVEQGYAREELRVSYREPAWTDRLLGAPPDMRQQQRSPCVLFPDRGSNYTRLTFLGCELDLQLLDILVFSVCQLWFGNTASSLLLVYLAGAGLRVVRSRLGQANVARKALVDERFLI